MKRILSLALVTAGIVAVFALAEFDGPRCCGCGMTETQLSGDGQWTEFRVECPKCHAVRLERRRVVSLGSY